MKQLRGLLFIAINFLPAFFVRSELLFAVPEYQFQTDSATIQADETVVFELSLAWPRSEGEYTFGVPEPQTDNLTLLRRAESQEVSLESGNHLIRKHFRWIFRPEHAGRAEFKGFTVTFLDEASQMPGALNIQGQVIEVKRTPFKINQTLIMILAITGLVGAILLLWLLAVRNRKRSAAKEEPRVTREEAILHEMRAISSADRKETLIQVSRLLRRFIAEYYGIKEQRQPLHELLEVIRQKNIPHEEIEELERLMTRINEFKYMQQSLTEHELQNLQTQAAQFIESKSILSPR